LQNLDVEKTKKGLKASVFDGAFAQFHANLTGTIFLPAFALLLNASDLQIGILASLPFFTTLAQLLGSYLVHHSGNCKRIAIIFALLSRSLWLPVVILISLLLIRQPVLLLQLFILIIMVHHALASISGVSWLSWMSVLVPAEIRGRFFGLRNSILGIVTVTVTIAGGFFLDWFGRNFPQEPQVHAFQILFSLALIAGMISVFFLTRQPDVPGQCVNPDESVYTFRMIFRHVNFRKFLRFAVLWQFAVNFASPFFVVYFIKDLHLSYTLISMLTITSALADLIGMGFWGHFADQIGNKPIIFITTAIGSCMPLLWLFSDASQFSILVLMPLLHIIGGFVFSGYNLCSVNLVFGLVPKQNNSAFFAVWSACNGLAAGLGAISAGLLAKYTGTISNWLPFSIDSGFYIIFFISGMLRMSSVLFLRNIREGRSLPVLKAVRILRSVRFWATTMGYHPLLQFFISASPSEAASDTARAYWPLWRFRKLMLGRE
jgi:MFS family permease